MGDGTLMDSERIGGAGCSTMRRGKVPSAIGFGWSEFQPYDPVVRRDRLPIAAERSSWFGARCLLDGLKGRPLAALSLVR